MYMINLIASLLVVESMILADIRLLFLGLVRL